MLIKRGVFEALSSEVREYAVERLDSKNFTPRASTRNRANRSLRTIYFCRLARRHGFKVYAAPWIHLTHTGTYVFDSQLQPRLGWNPILDVRSVGTVRVCRPALIWTVR